MALPEGSIAEEYLAYEFINLCSRYLEDVETIHNRPGRVNDIPDQEEVYLSLFSSVGRPLGGRKTRDLDVDELQHAHIYVLRNCDEVQSFISEYINITKDSQIHPFTTLWNRNFIAWFKENVLHSICNAWKAYPLFRCKWVDIFNKNRGIKTDIYGLVSVNFKCLLRTNEPFVLTTQASQVFSVKNNLIKCWDLVVKMEPGDTYDVPLGESDDEVVGPTDDDGIQYAKGKVWKPNTICNDPECTFQIHTPDSFTRSLLLKRTNDSEEEQGMEDWDIWNRTAKKFKSTNKNLDAQDRRDEGRNIAQDRMRDKAGIKT
ncbi:hypothetical protein U9M48_023812 [Paspalum notatum var. saurae]|uniref:DUF4218 domain-containing protein n=1 Tax=Paspalum notatum var. saurae TaxID=547442 RepID=A0AAQ3TMF6_PASNO